MWWRIGSNWINPALVQRIERIEGRPESVIEAYRTMSLNIILPGGDLVNVYGPQAERMAAWLEENAIYPADEPTERELQEAIK